MYIHYIILHTFPSVKFKNVKITLRKSLNNHRIILKVEITALYWKWILFYNVLSAKPCNRTISFNPLNLLFQSVGQTFSILMSFAVTKLKPKQLTIFEYLEFKYMTLMVHTETKYVNNILVWALFITEDFVPGLTYWY